MQFFWDVKPWRFERYIRNTKAAIYLVQNIIYLLEVSCMFQPYVVFIRLAATEKIITHLRLGSRSQCLAYDSNDLN